MKKIVTILFLFNFIFANTIKDKNETLNIECRKIKMQNEVLNKKNENLNKQVVSFNKQITNLNKLLKEKDNKIKSLEKKLEKNKESLFSKIDFLFVLKVIFGIWILLFIYFYLRKKFNW